MLHKNLNFPPETFVARRRKLMDKIGPESMIIIPSAMPKTRNGDNEYVFRQDSNFYYLTGFIEPLAVAILIPGRQEGEYILFNRARNPKIEIYTGKWAGQEGAIADFGANQSFAIDTLNAETLYQLCAPYKKIYYPMGGCHEFFPQSGFSLKEIMDQVFEKRRIEVLSRSAFWFFSQHDTTEIIYKMRLVKDSEEIEHIQHAVNISIQGHMRSCKLNPKIRNLK